MIAEGQDALAQRASALGQAPEIIGFSESVVSGLCPRLLDLGATAAYLGVSSWTVRGSRISRPA